MKTVLFQETHAHYKTKAEAFLAEEYEENQDEDSTQIAYRCFNETEWQFQQLYDNADDLFRLPSGAHPAPAYTLRVLYDMMEYVKDILDCESVDVSKIECSFALALAVECAREVV